MTVLGQRPENLIMKFVYSRCCVCWQVLANLPSVEKMAAAEDLQKFLNHHHKHAYRLVSCVLLWSACAFWTLLHLNFVKLCRMFVLQVA